MARLNTTRRDCRRRHATAGPDSLRILNIAARNSRLSGVSCRAACRAGKLTATITAASAVIRPSLAALIFLMYLGDDVNAICWRSPHKGDSAAVIDVISSLLIRRRCFPACFIGRVNGGEIFNIAWRKGDKSAFARRCAPFSRRGRPASIKASHR